MEFTQADRETINKTALLVERIDERLGENGTGLCGTVKEHDDRLTAHDKSLHRVYLILAFAAGGGGLTVGILSKLIGT